MENTLEKQPKIPYASRKDIIKIFELIHNRNEPTPINASKLKTLNIGSPTQVILMLKTFGFVDNEGTLTSKANDLKGTSGKFKTCLEEKVKEVYKDLFNTVKDGLNPECESEVRNYFKNHYTDVKKRMLEIYTACFLTLRNIINSNGDFKSLKHKEPTYMKKDTSKSTQNIANEKSINKNTGNSRKNNSEDIKLTLNLNVNLAIGTPKEAIEELLKNIVFARNTVFGEFK